MNQTTPRDRDSTEAASTRKSSMRAVVRGLPRGFASGLAATAVMSAVMVAAQKTGLLGQMPPQKISDRFLEFARVRRGTSKGTRRALATVAHFGFGGACGALFGAGHAFWRQRSSARESGYGRILAGIVFGTGVWAASYAGWVPALDIMPRPGRDRAGRPATMVVAHWVFGATLAKLVGSGR